MPSLPIIITTAVLLVLALVTPLFSPFFRKVTPQKEESNSENDEEHNNTVPPVSIIITDHDSSYHLSQVLTAFLEQDYPNDYQVIVVIDQSDSESEDILKRHSNNPRLYYTTLPDTSRYLSRKKLGITLGIRAAKHEWVLVTDIHSKPTSPLWLKAMASHCHDTNNMVLGLSLYGEDTSHYLRYEQMRTMLYYLRAAEKGMAISTNQPNIMMRKSEFFAANGFLGNLERTRAEFEFLVNKFAKEDSCAIAIEPEARMSAIKPSGKRWLMKQLFAKDALPLLKGMGRIYWTYKFDLAIMNIYNLLTFASIIMSVLILPSIDGIVLLSASIALWLLSLALRIVIYKPVLQYYNNISPMFGALLDCTLTWRDMILRIRYALTDKNEFLTHKL